MTGMADRRADSGSGSTPRKGAESIGTDTVASPLPASCWVIRPPKEWPMTAGLCCRAEIAGIAWLPAPHAHPAPLADCLESIGTGLVGISPRYEDLRHTARSLRLARIALRGAFGAQRVTVFDRDPLAIAAASAPDVMQRVASTILAALDQLPARDRSLLLDTFGAWLDSGGSAQQAGSTLFCHPNTVRHRLRRLEQPTGRSLAPPRETPQ